MGNTSGKSKGKSTSNSEVELKSVSVQEVTSKAPDKAPSQPTPQAKEKISHPVASTSENSSAESKDTVIFKPQQPQHPNAFGFTFKPMRPQATPTAPQQSSSTAIPYSPPPPYNPTAAAEKLKNAKSKHVQVYDPPPEDPEEIHVIEVRDCACQTKESFTEKYLRDVHFGGPRVYRPPSSSRSSPTVLQVQPPVQVSLGKRAPLARGEAVEVIDVPRKHMRKVPRGPADVLMFPKSPSSIASVDASTGSLELLSELDELEELRDKTKEEQEDDDDEEEEDQPGTLKRSSISGYTELD